MLEIRGAQRECFMDLEMKDNRESVYRAEMDILVHPSISIMVLVKEPKMYYASHLFVNHF